MAVYEHTYKQYLGKLTPEQEMAVDALTRGIINKIMHTPIRSLKSAAVGPEMTTLVDTFRKIFDLHDKSQASLEDETPADDLKKGQRN